MDASFIPVEVVPSKTPFGLDQLRRSYKTALSAEDAIAAAPAVGAADGVFPNMFLMPVSTPESAESATRIDLVYMGSLSGSGGSPALPDAKHDESNAVQSASSSKANTGGTFVSPLTIQYYAPTSSLTYFSFGGPGTTEAPVPTAVPVIITVTTADTAFSAGSLQGAIDAAFTLQVLSTIESTEVVPGKYWQNVARKAKTYTAWIFDIVSGAYVTLYSPGNGYTAGDSLSISAGGEGASITVDAVGSIWGGGTGITSWHTTANTFTTSHNALAASGGSGSGAGFNVFVI